MTLDEFALEDADIVMPAFSRDEDDGDMVSLTIYGHVDKRGLVLCMSPRFAQTLCASILRHAAKVRKSVVPDGGYMVLADDETVAQLLEKSIATPGPINVCDQ